MCTHKLTLFSGIRKSLSVDLCLNYSGEYFGLIICLLYVHITSVLRYFKNARFYVDHFHHIVGLTLSTMSKNNTP